MKTEKLVIYSRTYSFIKEVYKCVTNMKRADKAILGARLLDYSVELVRYIQFANRAVVNKEERRKCLNNYLVKLAQIKLLIRLGYDLKLVGLNKMAEVAKYMEEMERLAAGWINATNEK